MNITRKNLLISISIRSLLVWRHLRKGVKYAARRFDPLPEGSTTECRFWLHIWTPTWHEGRGPYVSIGVYEFAFYRGY